MTHSEEEVFGHFLRNSPQDKKYLFDIVISGDNYKAQQEYQYYLNRILEERSELIESGTPLESESLYLVGAKYHYKLVKNFNIIVSILQRHDLVSDPVENIQNLPEDIQIQIIKDWFVNYFPNLTPILPSFPEECDRIFSEAMGQMFSQLELDKQTMDLDMKAMGLEVSLLSLQEQMRHNREMESLEAPKNSGKPGFLRKLLGAGMGLKAEFDRIDNLYPVTNQANRTQATYRCKGKCKQIMTFSKPMPGIRCPHCGTGMVRQ